MTSTRVRLSPKTRRIQIVRSAIAIIAESGYAAATFSRIAEYAGLSSTGLISYHFENRDELMREVVAAVHQHLADFVRPRMDLQTSPSAAVREYIVASIEFHARYPQLIAAVDAVRRNTRSDERAPEPEFHEPGVVQLEMLMRRAQMLGEMSSFDAKVAAVSLRHMVDGATQEVRAGRADPARYTTELLRLFATATGQETPA